jgi:5-methylcytosine-specific restriction endonuclease McrA
LWRGGIANFRSSLRTTFLYRTWRSDVLTRDDFTCQICFIRGGKLNVDHIKAFSIILDENNIKTHEDAASCDELWNINNGRVLCVSCHKQTDNFGYKASNLNKRTKS